MPGVPEAEAPRARSAVSGCASRLFAVTLVALLATAAVLGCGGDGENPAAGLDRNADTARDVQAYSSVQRAMAVAALVRADSGGFGTGAEDLAQRLKARDPSLTFTTAASNGSEEVQVVGGGTSPVMLVAKSSSDAYLAGWTDGAATRYYRGEQAPQLSATPPQGGGWSPQPPL